MSSKQEHLCQMMEQYAADDVMVAFSGGVGQHPAFKTCL